MTSKLRGFYFFWIGLAIQPRQLQENPCVLATEYLQYNLILRRVSPKKTSPVAAVYK